MSGGTKVRVPELSFRPVGRDNGAEPGHVVVDLATLMGTRLLIQAASGAGKSYLIRSMAEQTHDQVQTLILDSKGEFVSLRERFPFVVVGPGGDLPAEVHAADALCEGLLEMRVSAVLNLQALDLEARREFVRMFLERILAQPLGTVQAHVILDEAHRFMPQVGTASSLRACISIADSGRGAGIGFTVATQRLTKIHNDVAAELHNRVIGFTGLGVDVKRAADDLGFRGQEAGTLSQLDPGEFFAYGPAISRTVVRVRSAHVLTTHPKPGEILPPTPPAPEALARVLQALRDRPAPAPSTEAVPTPGGADDPRRAPALADRALLERYREEQRVFMDALRGRLRRIHGAAGAVGTAARSVGADADRLQAAVGALLEEIGAAVAPGAEQAPVLSVDGVGIEPLAEPPPRRISAPGTRWDTAPAAPVESFPPGPPVAADGLSGPQLRILAALHVLHFIGQVEPTRKLVGHLCGVVSSSGSFRNNYSALHTSGLIDYPEDKTRFRITPKGMRVEIPAAVLDQIPQTVPELHALWMRKVTTPQGRILALLLRAWPRHLKRAKVAAELGLSSSSGSFRNNLSRLSALGLARYPDRTTAQAGETMFPQGMPPGESGG